MENIISRLRKQNRITQGHLANALGVSRQTISAIENGHYYPTLKLALKIAQFFKLPIEKIFTFKSKQDKN